MFWITLSYETIYRVLMYDEPKHAATLHNNSMIWLFFLN